VAQPSPGPRTILTAADPATREKRISRMFTRPSPAFPPGWLGLADRRNSSRRPGEYGTSRRRPAGGGISRVTTVPLAEPGRHRQLPSWACSSTACAGYAGVAGPPTGQFRVDAGSTCCAADPDPARQAETRCGEWREPMPAASVGGTGRCRVARSRSLPAQATAVLHGRRRGRPGRGPGRPAPRGRCAGRAALVAGRPRRGWQTVAGRWLRRPGGRAGPGG